MSGFPFVPNSNDPDEAFANIEGMMGGFVQAIVAELKPYYVERLTVALTPYVHPSQLDDAVTDTFKVLFPDMPSPLNLDVLYPDNDDAEG